MELLSDDSHCSKNDWAEFNFETEYSNKTLSILKVLIDIFPANLRPYLAIYIRVKELSIAFHKLRFPPKDSTAKPLPSPEMLSPIFDRLKPFCSEEEYQNIQSIQTLFSSYKQFQDMMPYLQMLSQTSSTDDTGNDSALDFMHILNNLSDFLPK